MISFKKHVRLFVYGLYAGAFLSLYACTTEDKSFSEDPAKNFNPYVLTLSIESSNVGDATSSSYYNVPFEQVMNGTLNAVHRGTENKGTYDFEKLDQTIYAMSDYDKTELEGIRKNTATQRVEKFGDIKLSQGISDIKKADKNTLLAISKGVFGTQVLKFMTLEANTTRGLSDKTIKVSSEWGPFQGKEGIDYSGMALRKDQLFVSYYIAHPKNYETNHIDTARVAVFSYPELELQKIIKDTRVGPIGGFGTRSGLIKDEKGTIYALSNSNPSNGFLFQEGASPKPSGILRIKAGESDFDPDYFFKIDKKTQGGSVANIKYLQNGKAFAEINTAARSKQDWLDNHPLRSAIVDVENQQVHFIKGVPEHTGEGRRMAALYEDPYIYMAIREKEGLFVYKMNTENYTAERGAKVEANSVVGFFKL